MVCIEEKLMEMLAVRNIDRCRAEYNLAVNNYDKNLDTYKEILINLLKHKKITDEYIQLKRQIAGTMIDIKNKTQTLYIQ
ncbi:MAG: hypothetical protein ABH828_02350 [archaeon]